MESVLGRYRNLIILVGVLFLQVLGLAVQVKRGSDAENTRLIRIWAVSAVTPLEKGLVALQNGTGNLWRNYLFLRGVRAENRDLKEQIEHMRLEQVRLSEDAAQARRLQSLLAFKEQYISKTLAAQVIGSIPTDLSRGIYIDKGSDEGVQPDMAVITAGGIVGKVLRVFPSTALILLINDQTSGVGAVLEKTRLQGVLKGTPNGEVLLERVMNDEQVAPGETVLTSGGDQIFPKGLPVGTIARVSAAKDLFLNITVKPSANLDKLEEVLVVLQKQEKQAAAEEGQRARAADILAQRLPSVPDQPAANANVTGASPSGNPRAATPAASEPSAKLPPATPQPPKSNPSADATSHTAPVAMQPGPSSAPARGLKNTGQQTANPQSSPEQGAPADHKKPAAARAKPATPPASSAEPKSSPSQSPSQPPADQDVPH